MFINVEGIDCSGKTTITNALSKKLGFTPFNSIVSPISRIKQDLMENWSHLSRYYIFTGCNLELSKQMKKEIYSSRGVISDRYIWSTLSYHIALGALTNEEAKEQFNILKDKLLMPDIVLYLNINRETQLLRSKYRQDGLLQNYLIKSEEFQEQLKKAYNEVSNWGDCLWLDINCSNGDIDQITMIIEEQILHLIE